MDDFRQFLVRNVVDGFPSVFQFLEGLDGGLGHVLMRFRRAADQREILPTGDPLVPVLVVEADAKKMGSSLLFLVHRSCKLFQDAGLSSGFSSHAEQ